MYTRNLGVHRDLEGHLRILPSSVCKFLDGKNWALCIFVWYSIDTPRMFTELNCFKGIRKLRSHEIVTHEH